MARRVLHDQFFKQAKAEGYVARSAYKLKEIVERKRLMRRGDRVLDLGCAPGAWLQVAAEIVGPRGLVVGLDLLEVRRDFGERVRALVGDAFETPATELTAAAAGEGGGGALFDVALSDMAPNTSGAGGGSSDHFLSVRLCERVLELLPDLLKPGGNLCMKVFEGERYADLLRRVGTMFGAAKGFKPQASREVSREMYIVATGYAPVRS